MPGFGGGEWSSHSSLGGAVWRCQKSRPHLGSHAPRPFPALASSFGLVRRREGGPGRTAAVGWQPGAAAGLRTGRRRERSQGLGWRATVYRGPLRCGAWGGERAAELASCRRDRGDPWWQTSARAVSMGSLRLDYTASCYLTAGAQAGGRPALSSLSSLRERTRGNARALTGAGDHDEDGAASAHHLCLATCVSEPPPSELNAHEVSLRRAAPRSAAPPSLLALFLSSAAFCPDLPLQSASSQQVWRGEAAEERPEEVGLRPVAADRSLQERA